MAKKNNNQSSAESHQLKSDNKEGFWRRFFNNIRKLFGKTNTNHLKDNEALDSERESMVEGVRLASDFSDILQDVVERNDLPVKQDADVVKEKISETKTNLQPIVEEKVPVANKPIPTPRKSLKKTSEEGLVGQNSMLDTQPPKPMPRTKFNNDVNLTNNDPVALENTNRRPPIPTPRDKNASIKNVDDKAAKVVGLEDIILKQTVKDAVLDIKMTMDSAKAPKAKIPPVPPSRERNSLKDQQSADSAGFANNNQSKGFTR